MTAGEWNPDMALFSVAHRAATDDGQRVAFRIIEDAHGTTSEWTAAQVDLEARRVAARLQDQCSPGARALIMCEPGISYVVAFFGCMYAGVTAVPAYPPSPMTLERSLRRLRGVAADAEAELAITSSMLMPFTADMEVKVADRAVRWFQVDGSDPGTEEAWKRPEVRPDDVALLQYTSGSTGDARGVKVTHGNLSAHLPMVKEAYSLPEGLIAASWLPPYHDMGLVSGLIGSVVMKGTSVLMSPELFLRRPRVWLEAISRYGAYFSAAPNFAFDLCVRRIPPADRDGLDLSSWKRVCNGAEPVRASTLDRFVEAFAPYGFDRHAFFPSYGLAEVVVLVSTATVDRPGGVLRARAGSVQAGRFEPAEPGDPARELVSCGRPPTGAEVVVVDPEAATPVADDVVGELWVRGPHVTGGYWNRQEESEELFSATLTDGTGPYLRTGDLGFMHDGDVFVTGRIKDLIIVRGLNHYPQDIERTVEQVDPALRPGCGAAFAEGDSEGLVIVQELAETGPDPAALVEAIRRAVVAEHQIEPASVVLVAARTVPKTSSGKIQRRATRAAYQAGDLQVVHRWHAG